MPCKLQPLIYFFFGVYTRVSCAHAGSKPFEPNRAQATKLHHASFMDLYSYFNYYYIIINNVSMYLSAFPLNRPGQSSTADDFVKEDKGKKIKQKVRLKIEEK